MSNVRVGAVPPGLTHFPTLARHCRAGLSHAAASRLGFASLISTIVRNSHIR